MSRFSLPTVSLFLFVLTFAPVTTHANVYATNVRLNGGFTNVVAPAATNVAITYILNEPATLGVSININSGATTVRTITLTNPNPGTLQGSNYFVWDGRNNASNAVPGGVYSVNITAASSGYTNWTETSSELDDFDYRVFWPRGIAVNRNTNSPYYGRVFVANASEGFDTTTYPGDRVGITLHNADGSYADEGGYSTGGYDWAHGDTIADEFSPWKLEVGSDDRLYANDFSGQGLVFSFDQLVSTNSFLPVLGTNNYPTPDVKLDGPFVSGIGGTLQIWMADSTNTAGIVRWNLTAAGTLGSNDTGVTIIQPNSPAGLDSTPQDVALDSSNNIYVIQDSERLGDQSVSRVLRFPAYTNMTETDAEWRIGSGDDSMRGAAGVAVDPTGTYVAVAFKGFFDGNSYQNGSLQVFAASNGAPLITLAPGDDHHDAAWDNVGNLYAVDGFASRWRSYSPPGTNQVTTVAVPTIRIAVPTAPVLSKPSYAGAAGQFAFTLTGEANASYVILSSTDLSNWTPVATNTSALAVRQITNTVSGNRTFFRARLGP